MECYLMSVHQLYEHHSPDGNEEGHLVQPLHLEYLKQKQKAMDVCYTKTIIIISNKLGFAVICGTVDGDDVRTS